MAWKWFRRVASVAVVALVAVAAVVGLLAWQATRVPDWYRPPAVTEADRLDIQRTSFEAACQINNPMAAGKRYTVTLEQEAVNRWLAMPSAVVPELAAKGLIDKVSAQVEAPMFIFAEGQITLAARMRVEGRSTVVSVSVRPELIGGELKLTATSVRAGEAPVPLGLLELTERRMGSGRVAEAVARVLGGEGIANDFVWPNGKLRFRFTEITAEDGRLRVGIEPRGRVRGRRRGEAAKPLW